MCMCISIMYLIFLLCFKLVNFNTSYLDNLGISRPVVSTFQRLLTFLTSSGDCYKIETLQNILYLYGRK